MSAHDTVLELFPAELRRGLFAVGRLDKDTEGLLLITDDGALSHALMSPNRHVEKEYEAVVDGALAADAVLRFEQGMTRGTARNASRRSWKSSRPNRNCACV